MRIMGDIFSLAISPPSRVVAFERAAYILLRMRPVKFAKKKPVRDCAPGSLIDKTNHAVRAQPRRNNWTVFSPRKRFNVVFFVNFKLRVDHECARVKPF